MRTNTLKKMWAEKRPAVNGWLSAPCIYSAEVMARAGWDSLTIDMQHGLVGYESAAAMLTAMFPHSPVPLARVPWLEEGAIMKALDAGAMGIICPMVNTAADAERFVSSVRYPPAGRRSFGPARAKFYGDDYPAAANDETVALAMIETREAMDNLDDILKTPGLDAIYIGPSDLANSLGFAPKFDPEEPAVVKAMDEIIAAARARNIVVGVHNATPEYALRMIKKGCLFATVASDLRLMDAGARSVLKAMRESEK